MTRKYSLISCIVFLSCTSILITPVCSHEEVPLMSLSKDNGNSNLRRKAKVSTGTDTAQRRTQSTEMHSLEKGEEEYFLNLVQRMKPHFFEIESREDGDEHDHEKEDHSKNSKGSYFNPPPKQFFHLHHMKTGGTSLSSYISCSIKRYTKLYNYHSHPKNTHDQMEEHKTPLKQPKLQIPQYRLSECSKSSYDKCISQPENYCHNAIAQATAMTYCAPLAITNHFGWSESIRHHDEDHIQTYSSSSLFGYESHTHNPTPSVTMLRNPVDRVWSMYRFQTKSCYQCKSLIDIYKDIDAGNKTYIEETYGTGVCVPQLMNHFTRNLLMNLTLEELNDESKITLTDEEKVKDAIHSIRHRFTIVGIIEKLEETLKLLEYSFPWMSGDIGESDYYQDWKYQNVTMEDATAKSFGQIKEGDMKCTFPHANQSPSNNRCGEHYTNMELPDYPDEETRKAIIEHNMLDLRVYKAALEHFELQKRAMSYKEDAEEDLE